MKNLSKLFIFGLLAMFVFVSCGKQPVKKIEEAQAAIDLAIKADAEKYAAADLEVVKQELQAAMDEMKGQDGKLFKNYDKAKEMLAKVKSSAKTLITTINSKKEEAKNNAAAAQIEIKTSLEALKAELDKLPKSKTPNPEIENVKTEVIGLDAQVKEIQTLIDAQDFLGANDKVGALKAKIASLNERISQEITKAAEKKGGKKVKK